MKIGLWIEVYQTARVIYDRKTKKIIKVIPMRRKILEREAHSFVENFFRILRTMLTSLDEEVVATDGGSTSITDTQDLGSIRVTAVGGDDSYGIVVGSGTTPPTPGDYTLESKIPHGTGAGQLSYGETGVSAVSVKGNDIYLYIDRTFTNLSGADIDISETGLIGWNTSADHVLLARDVFSPPLTVADGAAITIRYTIKATT
ncbi:MAG: hypothetical protein DRJ67_05130 [Thermoprotei archaeon]|mgnify:CR=1 FL=1|nr:MAG: hypothetical protein DRJ67_05130 [Thermoprotei archaeon]